MNKTKYRAVKYGEGARAMLPSPEAICGFDNHGEVFDGGTVILRRVHADYETHARAIYSLFEKLDLKRFGIVPTSLSPSTDYLLEHIKYPINYPHEWSSAMLRDAALFHLRLFSDLEENGISLKDGLPNNIIYDGTNPKFVDFLSLVETNNLNKESWLIDQSQGAKSPASIVLQNMFIPYFLIPLIAMDMNDAALGRQMLRENACNVSQDWPHIAAIAANRLPWRQKLKLKITGLLIRGALSASPQRARRILGLLLTRMRYDGEVWNADVPLAPRRSPDPCKDDGDWLGTSIAAALEQMAPATVLHLGSGPTRHPFIAEEKGARVISVSDDDITLNWLYHTAKQERRNITPLFIPFVELHSHTVVKGARKQGEIFFKAAVSRLKSDVVLVTDLLHRLIFGEGRQMDEVIETLSQLCAHHIILEFVPISDPCMRDNPHRYPYLSHWSEEAYTVDLLVKAAERVSMTCRIDQESPNGRHLVILTK